MKILLICYEYPPIGGGGGVGAQQYAEAWVESGHQVTVLTSQASGLARQETVAGVTIIRVLTIGRTNRYTSSLLSMFCYNITALLYVVLHRRELRAFHVMNTHFSIPTGPMACAAARILGLPNVLTVIGGDIYDPCKKLSPHRHAIFRLLNRWIINSADHVIAISSDTKRRVEQYYCVRRPMRVVNYGFKPLASAIKPNGNSLATHNKFFLIAIGRLVRRKAFDTLISAMKHLPVDVELLLVGDGPLKESLRKLAAQSGVSDRVHMLGYQPRTEIHRLLRNSHCFVLSSIHEGLGIVVQEAMDAGLPVVATNNGGQVDLIKEGRNGLLVEPNDEQALAKAIRMIYSDRSLAETMARNNLADIRSLYMDTNSQVYVEAFQDVLRLREV
jgi:glycosyltransferase involved in cell wall biosynthesis